MQIDLSTTFPLVLSCNSKNKCTWSGIIKKLLEYRAGGVDPGVPLYINVSFGLSTCLNLDHPLKSRKHEFGNKFVSLCSQKGNGLF
jgi:hypothetical protein